MARSYAYLYDGKEHDFRDNDQTSENGREQVGLLLGLGGTPTADGLRFHLSFYSGGIGVLDKHSISMNADQQLWTASTTSIKGSPPSTLLADKEWGEDFNWLVTADETFPSIEAAAICFINSERADFQTECAPDMRMLFAACSDVNGWSALWGTETRLSYLYYDQG